MAYLKQLKVTFTRKRVDDDLLGRPVKEAKQVVELFKDMQDETKEKVVAVHLNPQLEILSYEVVAMGTARNALVDAGEVFRNVLLAHGSSVIMVHNHPSGNPEPSDEDRGVVLTLADAGRLLERPLQDFIIIGDNGRYFSFAEQGFFPE